MSPGKNQTRRKPIVSRATIQLREMIVRGELGNGARLPTRIELRRDFNLSMGALQSALDELTAEGFIVSRGKLGTFVAPDPPHTSTWGVAYLDAHTTSLFQKTVGDAVTSAAQERQMRLSKYFLDAEGNGADLQRLLDDLSAPRLAGVLLLGVSARLNRQSPLLTMPGIRRACLTASDPFESVPTVSADKNVFWARAIDYLVGRGRRKIAIIDEFWDRPHLHERIGQLVRAGVSRRAWIQACHHLQPWTAHQAALVLMQFSGADRPDGLIIGDDHCVADATAGLAESGVNIPDELEIVADCNYPNLQPNFVPVKWLGFDARRLASRALDLLLRQQQGLETQLHTALPPQFQDELSTVHDGANVAADTAKRA